MPLVGIIAKKRDIQAIKKELAEYEVEIIHLNKEALKKMGWKVMTVWECQLKSAVREKTLLEVEYWINHSYLERFKQKPFRIYDVEGASLPIVAEGYMKYGKPE